MLLRYQDEVAQPIRRFNKPVPRAIDNGDSNSTASRRQGPVIHPNVRVGFNGSAGIRTR